MTRRGHRSLSVDDAPIIRSRVDTDVSQLLMAQSVLRHRPAVEV